MRWPSWDASIHVRNEPMISSTILILDALWHGHLACPPPAEAHEGVATFTRFGGVSRARRPGSLLPHPLPCIFHKFLSFRARARNPSLACPPPAGGRPEKKGLFTEFILSEVEGFRMTACEGFHRECEISGLGHAVLNARVFLSMFAKMILNDDDSWHELLPFTMD